MLKFDEACSCLHFTTTGSRIGANNGFCARRTEQARAAGRAGKKRKCAMRMRAQRTRISRRCHVNKTQIFCQVSNYSFSNTRYRFAKRLPNVLVYLGGYQEDNMITAAMSSASNHRLDATESPAAPPDLTNSLTAASATIDLTRVEAIQKKRLVTFVNHFIQRTARND